MATPEFTRTDPALPEFWEMRYRAGFAPWEAGAVPARLREHVAGWRPQGPVLVPGCGSGHDVRFLADAGLDVLGIDFSAAALALAASVAGPHAGRLRRADFFDPALGGPFDLVYERAFLCALPRRLWPAWGERVAGLVAPGGFLAGFFYFDEGERGPPFPLHGPGELGPLLQAHFVLEADLDVPDSIPVFAGRERWMRWRRKPAI